MIRESHSFLVAPILMVLIGISCASEETEVTTCDYYGAIYSDGEVFPASDGCNTCSCNPNGDTPAQYECSGKPCVDLLVCDSAPLGDGTQAVTCAGYAGEKWQCECLGPDGIVGTCESDEVTSNQTNPCGDANCCGY